MSTTEQRLRAKQFWLNCKPRYETCCGCGKDLIVSRKKHISGWEYYCPNCTKRK